MSKLKRKMLEKNNYNNNKYTWGYTQCNAQNKFTYI